MIHFKSVRIYSMRVLCSFREIISSGPACDSNIDLVLSQANCLRSKKDSFGECNREYDSLFKNQALGVSQL